MSFPKGKELIRIAVVDDDLCACEFVSNHINKLENCKVMIQAGDGQEFLDKLQTTPKIDLVILDILMPGLDGYSTAGIVRTQYKNMRILFYSMCKTELALARMAASGGHGLIRKWQGSSQFAVAIRAVMGGNYFFPDMVDTMEIKEGNYQDGKNNQQSDLSVEQIGLLKWIGTEKPYKEIADILQISTRQLDYIREGLFKRFNVKNRVGLVILAYQSGVLPMALTA